MDFGACRTPMYLSYTDFVIGEYIIAVLMQNFLDKITFSNNPLMMGPDIKLFMN